MHRSTTRSIAAVFTGVIVAAMPLVANAQSVQPRDLTADEIRADYLARGYRVSKPIVWWTTEHPTTLRVSDPTSDRVLMVIVYPDSATAQTALSEAIAHEASSSDAGPRLIPGYGFSTWRQNVAFVETTWDDLARQFTAERARENQPMSEASTFLDGPAAPTYAVDLDLLNVIVPEAASL